MSLLDTHVVLWALSDVPRLTPPVREVLEAPATRVCVSVVSAWELRIKSALGTLTIEPVFSFDTRPCLVLSFCQA